MFGIDPKKYGFLEEEVPLNSSVTTNEVKEKLMSVKEVASVFDVSLYFISLINGQSHNYAICLT